jgi:hypothetical protein
VNDLMREAMRALLTCQRVVARRLLLRVLQENPHDAEAWRRLGELAPDAFQQEYCLTRARALQATAARTTRYTQPPDPSDGQGGSW